MTPHPDAPPIVWAVFLGANTVGRLAREWDVDYKTARRAMRRAFRLGWLYVMISGWHQRTPVVYGVCSIRAKDIAL